MATWVVNRGLAPCIRDVKRKYPGIVVYTIGDEEHQSRASDHNPNKAGRVNAADYMLFKGSSFGYADARWLSRRLIQDGRTKYVIYNREIWHANSQEWKEYTLPNPHTDHIHHSVWDSAFKDDSDWPLELRKLEMNKVDGYGVPHLEYGMDDRDYTGYNSIERVQRMVGATPDGVYGPQTVRALQRWFPGNDCREINKEMYCNLMGISWVGP